MEKSKTKTVVIITAIIAALLITGWIIWQHTPLIKGIIANNMYGNDTCNGNHSEHAIIPDAGLTLWRCPVCNRQQETGVTESHYKKLCSECARLTGRCSRCGKILKQGK